MTEFLYANVHNILTILASGTLVYVLLKWSSLTILQRMVGLQFFFVVVHTWEELRFPGGFVEMVQEKLNFTLMNPHFGELVLSVIVLIMFIPPLLFPRRTFLAMVPMMLGVLEVVAHSLATRMFDSVIPYSPGLISAVVLMLPVSVYSIQYTIRNKLLKPSGWAFAFLYMIFGLAIAQQIVVRSSGMDYFEFLANARKAMLGS